MANYSDALSSIDRILKFSYNVRQSEIDKSLALLQVAQQERERKDAKAVAFQKLQLEGERVALEDERVQIARDTQEATETHQDEMRGFQRDRVQLAQDQQAYTIITKELEVLAASNTQDMKLMADSMSMKFGLGALYSKHYDEGKNEDYYADMLEEMTSVDGWFSFDTPWKKGHSQEFAQRILGAYFSAAKGDYQPMVEVGAMLSQIDDPTIKQTAEMKTLMTGLEKQGYFSGTGTRAEHLAEFKEMYKALERKSMIQQERDQVASGDYYLDKDFRQAFGIRDYTPVFQKGQNLTDPPVITADDKNPYLNNNQTEEQQNIIKSLELFHPQAELTKLMSLAAEEGQWKNSSKMDGGRLSIMYDSLEKLRDFRDDAPTKRVLQAKRELAMHDNRINVLNTIISQNKDKELLNDDDYQYYQDRSKNRSMIQYEIKYLNKNLVDIDKAIDNLYNDYKKEYKRQADIHDVQYPVSKGSEDMMEALDLFGF